MEKIRRQWEDPSPGMAVMNVKTHPAPLKVVSWMAQDLPPPSQIQHNQNISTIKRDQGGWGYVNIFSIR